MRSVSIVIPAHNEEEIIRETVERLMVGMADLGLDSFEVIIAENGSTDATRRIAEQLAREHSHVRLLASHVADYGAAMRAGFGVAMKDAVVNFDADYYDLSFLAAALGTDADIVVGAKGIEGSDDARALARRVISRGFMMLVRILLGVRLRETHGMKAFRRAAIAPILPLVEATQDLFDTELLARAERAGLRITDLPVRTVELRQSRSAILRRIPRTLVGLIRMRRRLRRSEALVG